MTDPELMDLATQCITRVGNLSAEEAAVLGIHIAATIKRALADRSRHVAAGEIEKMRDMIRELADLLDDRLLSRFRFTHTDAYKAVVKARYYLAGPPYDFTDPAQRREEQNCGTSE